MASINFEETRLQGERLYVNMKKAADDDDNDKMPPRAAPPLNLEIEKGHSVPYIFGPQAGELRIVLELLDDYKVPVLSSTEAEVPRFENQVHTGGRIILCCNNEGRGDRKEGTAKPYMWTQYMAFAYLECVPAKDRHNLEQVWRVQIINPTTLAVIQRIQKAPPPSDYQGFAPIELDEKDPGFFELLATPNGKGVARMLTDYPALFGKRVVYRVVIHGNNNLCWHIRRASKKAVEAPTKEFSALSHREKRKLKRKSVLPAFDSTSS